MIKHELQPRMFVGHMTGVLELMGAHHEVEGQIVLLNRCEGRVHLRDGRRKRNGNKKEQALP